MINNFTIKLTDYTTIPGLRYCYQSPYSGQWFNIEFAQQIDDSINNRIEVKIDLNGVSTLNSSFIDSVFGRLVRIHGYDTIKTYLTYSADTLDFASEDIERIMNKNKEKKPIPADTEYQTIYMDLVQQKESN